MQVHLDTPHPGPGDIHATCNPGSRAPFAILKVGAVEIYLHDDADCDAIITTVTAAKRMRQAAASGEPHPFSGGAPGVRDGWCGTCGLLDDDAIHQAPAPGGHCADCGNEEEEHALALDTGDRLDCRAPGCPCDRYRPPHLVIAPGEAGGPASLASVTTLPSGHVTADGPRGGQDGGAA